MAADKPIQRGTPAGASQPAKTKMGQKMALVHQRLSFLDTTSSRRVDDDLKLTGEELAIVVRQQSKAVDDCDDPDGEVNFVLLRRKRETPADDSQSAITEMGKKVALVHQRLPLLDRSSKHVDDDDHFEPTGEELAMVVGQSMPVDDCKDPDGEIDYPPLRIVRPKSMENGQEKCPGFRYKHGAKKTRTCFTKSYKRKRGRPAGSKSAKRNMEQKPALFDSSSSSHSGSKSDKDDNLEPSDEDGNFEPSDKDGDFEPSDKDGDFEPTRKRRRPTGFKSCKSKKSCLVESSSSTEGKKGKDGDFEPEVSDDDGRKKYARVKDFYGTAWDTAVKVNEKLPAEGPSFVKLMLKSHVVRVFWLGLPVSFCRNYLPKHDVTIELEDEDGHSYDTKYLANKRGLSGGWNAFAQQHDLKVSDAVVFQLVRPTRFKVYMLRENKFTTTDGALSLLSLDTSKENNISEEDSSDDDVKSKEHPEVSVLSSKPWDNDSNNLASEEATDDDGIRPSDTDTSFASLRSFRNFKVIVDGSAINRRLLPDRLRRTYYKLCCERKAFLHRHLLKQINSTLAAGVIVQTVNIADGIRACSASASSLEDLASWKKILESFELMGMDVGFMRKRVDDLLALLTAQSTSRDLQIAAEECEGYEKVKLERDSAAEKMRALESRMSSLRDAVKEMDMEMKEMVESSTRKKKEQAMRQLAAAPW